jgi:hypothetical protein
MRLLVLNHQIWEKTIYKITHQTPKMGTFSSPVDDTFVDPAGPLQPKKWHPLLPGRHRLFFSDDDLARLKEEATPKEVPANMDNWVILSCRAVLEKNFIRAISRLDATCIHTSVDSLI